jgi:hypothetical protein
MSEKTAIMTYSVVKFVSLNLNDSVGVNERVDNRIIKEL